jgi:hypothetical protein
MKRHVRFAGGVVEVEMLDRFEVCFNPGTEAQETPVKFSSFDAAKGVILDRFPNALIDDWDEAFVDDDRLVLNVHRNASALLEQDLLDFRGEGRRVESALLYWFFKAPPDA